MRITYSECVFVALGMQYAVPDHAGYLRPCIAPFYNIIPHYLINGIILRVKIVIEHKIVIYITNLGEGGRFL